MTASSSPSPSDRHEWVPDGLEWSSYVHSGSTWDKAVVRIDGVTVEACCARDYTRRILVQGEVGRVALRLWVVEQTPAVQREAVGNAVQTIVGMLNQPALAHVRTWEVQCRQ